MTRPASAPNARLLSRLSGQRRSARSCRDDAAGIGGEFEPPQGSGGAELLEVHARDQARKSSQLLNRHPTPPAPFARAAASGLAG